VMPPEEKMAALAFTSSVPSLLSWLPSPDMVWKSTLHKEQAMDHIRHGVGHVETHLLSKAMTAPHVCVL
jgi:hypothetical protein